MSKDGNTLTSDSGVVNTDIEPERETPSIADYGRSDEPPVDHDSGGRPDDGYKSDCGGGRLTPAEIPIQSNMSPSTIDRLFENEDGDACLFVMCNEGRYLFDHSSGDWYVWAGHYWEPDRTNTVFQAFQPVIKEYSIEAKRQGSAATEALASGDKDAHARAEKLRKMLHARITMLRTRKRKTNVLYLSICGTSLATTGEDWDRNPLLLGFKNGVMDLETFEFRPGRQSDFIKTVAPHNWEGFNSKCPQWERFLADVFGNTELISFVHRLMGFAITGETTDHIFPIFWGKGRNGKGTLIETAKFCFGDLMYKAKSEMLISSRFPMASNAPDADTLRMMGKRIVWASETNEGNSANLGKIKEFTGADTLSARAPHGKHIVEFTPTHTLILMTNNKPQVDADDYAMWERIRLVPFLMSFVSGREPEAENERVADKALPGKLKSEIPGILAWFISGTREWRKHGLEQPGIVIDATKGYRNEEDTIGAFISEMFDKGPIYRARAKATATAYKTWCDENGKTPERKFSETMKSKYGNQETGTLNRDKNGLYYTGISFKDFPDNEVET